MAGKNNSIAHVSGFKICYKCKVKYYALSKKSLRCPECANDRSEYLKQYYQKVTKVKNVDKKLKSSENKIEKNVKGEFKGLLKEDHKIDRRLETAESKLRKMKKGC